MKNKLTLQKICYLMLIVLPLSISAQESISEWSFKTNGNIMNAPTVSNGTTYIGSYDNAFYAIDSLGQKIWSHNTGYPVQSGSLLNASIVCFQSGNRLHGLNASDGSQIWKHEPQEVLESDPVVMLNDIDIKDATPILKDSVAYYGNEYGKFYGIDISSGTELFAFDTEKGYPITSTGIFSNDTVYFGDMEGYVYAVNTETNEKLWEMRIYDGNKPYAESGPVIGNFVLYGDLLYFGLQHGILSVVNRYTGEVAWSIGDRNSTWYSGTPLLHNDIMYIGTSDTRQIVALDAYNGEQKWIANTERGIYNQPLLYNNQLIVLGGYDSWEKLADPNGSGRLVILDLDGNVINKISLKGSAFGNAVISNDMLYFGTMDDHIYKLSLEEITTNAKSEIIFDKSDLELADVTGAGNERIDLPMIYNNGSKSESLVFEWESNNLPEESISVSSAKSINAQDSLKSYITIKSRLLENADYELIFKIKSGSDTDLLIEKKISFTRNVVSILDKLQNHGTLQTYPNPFRNKVNFVLPKTFESGTLNLYDCNGKLLKSEKVMNKGDLLTISLNKKTAQQILYYNLVDGNLDCYSGKLIHK